ncbi:MAG: hypothetical protein PUP93_31730 [Rhizonema sp. NSF051]|nr:hypothetical protein [Rhizonema sp. NSF051]
MEIIAKEWHKTNKRLSQLIAKSWLPGEEKLKHQILQDPKNALAENGIDIPEGVEVVADTRSFNCSIVPDERQDWPEKIIFKLSYPPRPAEVTDEQLSDWVEGKVEQPAPYIPLTLC